MALRRQHDELQKQQAVRADIRAFRICQITMLAMAGKEALEGLTPESLFPLLAEVKQEQEEAEGKTDGSGEYNPHAIFDQVSGALRVVPGGRKH
jgi:hypothetical protein